MTDETANPILEHLRLMRNDLTGFRAEIKATRRSGGKGLSGDRPLYPVEFGLESSGRVGRRHRAACRNRGGADRLQHRPHSGSTAVTAPRRVNIASRLNHTTTAASVANSQMS